MTTIATQNEAAHAHSPKRVFPGKLLAINVVVGAVRRFAPPLSKTLHIQKRSAQWPFDGLVQWVNTNGARQLPEALTPVFAREHDLHRKLHGVVRETSFRNTVALADAAQVCTRVSSPRRGKALLHELIRIHQPQWIIELGSAFGIGSLAMASALEPDAECRFDGVEYEGWRAKIAQDGLSELRPRDARIHAGRIEDILPDIVRGANPGPDFAFVDAEHTYEATMGYHRLLSDCVRPGAIIVYDDIGWSPDMRRFWTDVVRDPRITDAISLGDRWGITRYAG
ncbi:MAG: O-methyltransferase [Phycisphaerales bacterium]